MRNAVILAALFLAFPANAQRSLPEAFKTGPLITEYGPVAVLDGVEAVPDGTMFRVSYDLTEGAQPGALNRQLVTAARFLNMHAAVGVAPENMHLALVLHSAAIFDVTRAEVYGAKKEGADNPNAALLETLFQHGVQVIVCGQSAASRGLKKADLLPGVRLAVSAMTAHALLQQEGYTLNPF